MFVSVCLSDVCVVLCVFFACFCVCVFECFCVYFVSGFDEFVCVLCVFLPLFLCLFVCCCA